MKNFKISTYFILITAIGISACSSVKNKQDLLYDAYKPDDQRR